MKRSHAPVAAALLALLAAVPAAADSIPIVTATPLVPFVEPDGTIRIVSGTWLVEQTYPSPATFDLLGADGSRFTGRWPYGSVQAEIECFGCQGGTSVSPAAFYTFGVPFLWGDPYAEGTAVIDGVSSDFFFGGTLSFGGATATLPQALVQSDEMSVVSLTLPFAFHGPLNGYELFGYREAQLRFSYYLYGHGLATLDFLAGGRIGEPVQYHYLGSRYDFQAPVPEPASLILLSTGLAAGLAAAWRRRRSVEKARE